MREIKFRGWDGSMTYSNKIGMEGFWAHAENGSFFEIMQYTGLKDKNGKEVYEGDVVYAHLFDMLGGDYEVRGEVKFDEGGCFVIEVESRGNITQLLFSDTSHWEEPCIEVLGNIHENPELLESP